MPARKPEKINEEKGDMRTSNAVQREKGSKHSSPATRAWSSSSRLRIHLSKQLVPFHKKSELERGKIHN